MFHVKAKNNVKIIVRLRLAERNFSLPPCGQMAFKKAANIYEVYMEIFVKFSNE